MGVEKSSDSDTILIFRRFILLIKLGEGEDELEEECSTTSTVSASSSIVSNFMSCEERLESIACVLGVVSDGLVLMGRWVGRFLDVVTGSSKCMPSVAAITLLLPYELDNSCYRHR